MHSRVSTTSSCAFLTVLTSLKNLKLEQKVSHFCIPLLKERDFVKERKSIKVRELFTMAVHLLRNEENRKQKTTLIG